MTDRFRVRAHLLLLMLAAALLAISNLPAHSEPQTLEVLGTARTNNRSQSLTFRIAAHQAHVSEIRIRSGSLPVTLVGIGIEYTDGPPSQIALQESFPAGHQSRAIPMDARRAVRRVLVTVRPGLRPGETTTQLLGKLAR